MNMNMNNDTVPNQARRPDRKLEEAEELQELLLLRESLGVADQAKIAEYNPVKAARKLGRLWCYDTLTTHFGGGCYHTRREAIAAAARHKALKQEQYDHPGDYTDIVRVRARKALARIKEFMRQGYSEMEACKMADYEEAKDRTV